MVCAVGRKIFSLEFGEAAVGETDRVRRAGQLEVDVRKLFGVLSLPGRASDVIESFALRFCGERSRRRAIPRRVHVDQQRQEPDHERGCMCVPSERRKGRGRGRETAGVLLFDFPEHAPEHAPGIRDGASAVAGVAGTDPHFV